MEEEGKLTVKISNNQPVELIDLTEAFFSLGEQYKRFIARNPEPTLPETIRLYVKEIKTGSIIVDLVAFAPLILPVIRDTNTVIGFTKYLKDAYGFFLRKNNKIEQFEKSDYNQLSKIIDIVAKDSGAQIHIHTTVHGTIHQEFNLNSLEANAAQNVIQQELKQLEASQISRYDKVLFYFYQAREDTRSQTGDKGIIEKISPIPKKIVFENEEIKRAMLHTAKNPFHLAYVVDVDIETINNKPALYKIVAFHESFDKPEG